MSNTTLIPGDFTVGRDAQVGGNSVTHGSAIVKRDMRVEGWLDAPNLVGACKGLFASGDALKASYPKPRPGWFAFVGDTFPADVYRVDNGEWAATGEQSYPVFTISDIASLADKITTVNELIETVETLKSNLETEAEGLIAEIKSLETEVQVMIEELENTSISEYFSVDYNGNIHVRNGKGFYSESFISVGGADADSNS